MDTPPFPLGKTFRSAVEDCDWPRAASAFELHAAHLHLHCSHDSAVEVALITFLRSAPIDCHQVLARAARYTGKLTDWRTSTHTNLILRHADVIDGALQRHDFASLAKAWERAVNIPPAECDARLLRRTATTVCGIIGEIEAASTAAAYAELSTRPWLPGPSPFEVSSILGPKYRGIGTLVRRMAEDASESGYHSSLPIDIILAGLRRCEWPTWRSLAGLHRSAPEILLDAAPVARRTKGVSAAAIRHLDWILAGKEFPELPPLTSGGETEIPF